MKRRGWLPLAALLVMLLAATAAAEGIVTLPEGLTVVTDEMFSGDDALVEVIVPEGVTQIGDYAFAHSGLERITLPGSVEKIGEGAFEFTEIESITIPEGVREIGFGAFIGSGIEQITLPESLEFIESNAFFGCDGLTAHVKRGSYAYDWCMDSYVQVMTEEGLETPHACFEFLWRKDRYYISGYSGEHEHVVLPAEYLGEAVTGTWGSVFEENDTMKTLTLPEGYCEFDSDAFDGTQHALTTVNLPSGITQLERDIFINCPKLTTIRFAEGSPFRTSSGGAVVNQAGDTLILVPKGLARGRYVIPEGITAIDEYAFGGCDQLTSVSIPESVTFIQGAVFAGCSALEEIEIPRTVPEIWESTFEDCSSLEEITLHAGITYFDYSAVHGCRSLEAIHVEEGNGEYVSLDGVLYTADMRTLVRCPEGKSGEVVIPSGVEIIGQSAFQGCKELTKIEIPASVTNADEAAFEGLKAEIVVSAESGLFTTVDGVLFSADKKRLILFPKDWEGSYAVPEGTVEIDPSAFENCTGLTAITFPDSLNYIGFWAFTGCTSLETVTIPASVTAFQGEFAFYGCERLTDIHMEEGSETCVSVDGLLLSWNSTVLYVVPAGRTGTLTVPGCVRNINYLASDIIGLELEDGASINARGLTEIIISEGVVEIEAYAFAGHKNLERVVLPASLEQCFGTPEEVFYGSGNVTFEVIEGSYAHEWCEENGAAYVLGADAGE